MNLPYPVCQYLDQLGRDDLLAVAILGSYARGSQRRFSDVDILCLLGASSSLEGASVLDCQGVYVTVSRAAPSDVEQWFSDPRAAVSIIQGLRDGRAYWDPQQAFASLQRRAHDFVWDEAMQSRADQYANQQLMGWLEEVYKSLQGLTERDIGRMLQGLHGLTFGLVDVLTVQQGVLLPSDNSFLADLRRHFQKDDGFVHWSQRAFGLYDAYTLKDRVWAGLHLFCWTVDYLEAIWEPPYRSAIELAKWRVEQFLLEYRHED